MRIAAVITTIGIAGSALCFGQGKGATTGGTMKTLLDSASYAIGMNIGNSLKQDSIQLDADLLRAAMLDVASGAKTRFNDSVAQMVLATFQQEVMMRAQVRMAKEQGAKGAINRQRGAEFLAANKNKQGVKVTSSGLQYIVEREGSGTPPDLNDVVKVHYRGTLVDGTEFDRSEEGSPVEFPVSGVIAGWTEALQLMKPGAKLKLFIPSELAYGERGAPGGQIGPNETLIFEVELLSVTQQ